MGTFNQRVSATIVTVVVAAAAPAQMARADHCPVEHLIRGKSERRLAGLDPSRDRFDRATRLFGQPGDTREFEDSSYPPGSGEAEYTWFLGGATLKVLTVYHRDARGRKVEAVQSVLVQGRSGPSRLHTGRGVGLGASRDDVKAAYGTTYFNGSLTGVGPAKSTITFCFEGETWLEFTSDEADRIVQVYLVPSAE